MISAATGIFCLRVLFIKLLLLLGCFLYSHEVVILSSLSSRTSKISAYNLLSHPADSSVLLRLVGALVKIVGMRKDFLRLLKPYTPFGVRLQPYCSSARQRAIASSYNCYISTPADAGLTQLVEILTWQFVGLRHADQDVVVLD